MRLMVQWMSEVTGFMSRMGGCLGSTGSFEEPLDHFIHDRVALVGEAK
jgi:hypothetical protein